MDANQARMARAALRLSIRGLALEAKVSPNTIARLEAGLPVNHSTLAVIRAVFESAGLEFTDGNQPGVRMQKEIKL